MESLLKSFDKIFLVNLDKRTDRLDKSMNMLEKYNLGDKLKRFSAIEAPKSVKEKKDNKGRIIKRGAVGLVLSLVEIIKESKLNDYESILVLEDDFIFKNEDFSKSVSSQLNSIEWDVFYLGANLHYKLNPKSDNLFEIKGGYATHAVAYNKSFYDFFLENFNEGKIGIIDVWLSEFAQEKLNCYCSWPILATQRESYSDIENVECNYDWMESKYYENTKKL